MKVNERSSWRADVRRDGQVAFACTVTPREAAWFVTDCVPQRRDPALAGMLLEVCESLVTDHGATNIVAVHPDFWGARLSAAGAVTLQRLLPLWGWLDNEQLLQARPLPPGFRLTPLDTMMDDSRSLFGLGEEVARAGDLHVWRETTGGDYGPLIPAGSLVVMMGDMPCGAIAVTEFQGAPLVAHLIVAEAARGMGLGRALLVHGMRGLADAGYVDCRLNVDEDNRAAERLFRSAGFLQNRPTQRVSHVWGRLPGHLRVT